MSATREQRMPAAHIVPLTLDRVEREALASRLIAYADEVDRWFGANDSDSGPLMDETALAPALSRRLQLGTDSCKLLADRLVWNGDLDLRDRITRLDVEDALNGWPASSAPVVPAALQRIIAAVEATPGRSETFEPQASEGSINLAAAEGRTRLDQQVRQEQQTNLWYAVNQYAHAHTEQLVRAAAAEQQRRLRDGQPAPSVDVIVWAMAYKAVRDQISIDRLASNEIAATLEDLRTNSGPNLMPPPTSDTGPVAATAKAVQGPARSL